MHVRAEEKDDGFGPGTGPSYGELYPETFLPDRVTHPPLAASSSPADQVARRRIVDGSSSSIPISTRIETPSIEEQVGAPSAIHAFQVVGSSPRESEGPEYIPGSDSDGLPTLRVGVW